MSDCSQLLDARNGDVYPDAPPPPAPQMLVDVVAGPRTIVALGEDCRVCEEGLEPGQVYVFVHDTHGGGVAHESCTDDLPSMRTRG